MSTTNAVTTAMPESGARELVIVSLYPRDMNIYGDRGNVLALERRVRDHGFVPRVVSVNPGDPLPAHIDIVVGGGGQDSGQVRVAQDLALRAGELRSLAESGVPMLVICGMYQLFGHRFVTSTGDILDGIGVLDVETVAGSDRMIGNIVLESEQFGEIIGYENHSGSTRLGAQSRPLGRVLQGAGNSPDAGYEGARSHSVIGSYLHGSLLPKNPAISDFLISEAVQRRYGEAVVPAPASKTVMHARGAAKRRPR